MSEKRSIQEFPGVCPVEVPDDERFQECRFEIPQIHSVASAGCGFNRLPMGKDTASPAAKIPECPIAPDVAFRVIGVTLDSHGTKFVVRPDSACAPTQRAVATGRCFGRCRQRKAHRSAVT
jgi:hypothetical protein